MCGRDRLPAPASLEPALVARGPHPAIVVGTEAGCAAAQPSVVVSTSSAANAIHWFSSGMIGFARGWNDAPKIAALCLLALPSDMGIAFAIVAAAMGIGGLVSGRRVLQTM